VRLNGTDAPTKGGFGTPVWNPFAKGGARAKLEGRLWRNAARIMYLRAGYIQSCFTVGPVACSRDRRRSIIPAQRISAESVDHPTRADDRSQSAIIGASMVSDSLKKSASVRS